MRICMTSAPVMRTSGCSQLLVILVKRHLNTVRNCELSDPKVLIYCSFSPSNFVFFMDHQKLPRPFVHNARKRGKALLESLLASLL